MIDEPPDLEQRMARLRRRSGPASFGSGFSTRVMSRLAAPRPMADGLERVFLRLAPLAAVESVLVGQRPLIDRLLGLPEVTLAAAYSLGDGAGWTEGSQ